MASTHEGAHNVVLCPFCGAAVIRGSDQCDGCGRELQGTDAPEALRLSESDLALGLDSIRLTKVRTVPPSATVREAIEALLTESSGAVVVTDQKRILGIFTERDVLKRIAARPERLDARVSEYMTPDPVVLRYDDTIATALNQMGIGQFRHIPVIHESEIEGMIVARDVIAWLLSRYFD